MPRHAAGRRPPSEAGTPPANEAASLQAAARELGLALSREQSDRLLAYCALLRKWNAVYNLTAIRDPQAMLVQHLFVCLAIVPPLTAVPEHGSTIAGAPASSGARLGPNLLADGAIVLDVGAGGGLPGVVLAVCAPAVQVHCIDAVGKKAAFVAQVRAELGLPNLHAHHARVEQLRAPRDLPAANLIVSRAFASLAEFVTLTEHLLASAGAWAAMKGQYPADELDALPASVRLAAAITLAVPQLRAQRHLLLLQRLAQ